MAKFKKKIFLSLLTGSLLLTTTVTLASCVRYASKEAIKDSVRPYKNTEQSLKNLVFDNFSMEDFLNKLLSSEQAVDSFVTRKVNDVIYKFFENFPVDFLRINNDKFYDTTTPSSSSTFESASSNSLRVSGYIKNKESEFDKKVKSEEESYKNQIKSQDWRIQMIKRTIDLNGGNRNAYKRIEIEKDLRSQFTNTIFSDSLFKLGLLEEPKGATNSGDLEKYYYNTKKLSRTIDNLNQSEYSDFQLAKIISEGLFDFGFFGDDIFAQRQGTDNDKSIFDSLTNDTDRKSYLNRFNSEVATSAFQKFVFNEWFKNEKPLVIKNVLFKSDLQATDASGEEAKQKAKEIYGSSLTGGEITGERSHVFPIFLDKNPLLASSYSGDQAYKLFLKQQREAKKDSLTRVNPIYHGETSNVGYVSTYSGLINSGFDINYVAGALESYNRSNNLTNSAGDSISGNDNSLLGNFISQSESATSSNLVAKKMYESIRAAYDTGDQKKISDAVSKYKQTVNLEDGWVLVRNSFGVHAVKVENKVSVTNDEGTETVNLDQKQTFLMNYIRGELDRTGSTISDTKLSWNGFSNQGTTKLSGILKKYLEDNFNSMMIKYLISETGNQNSKYSKLFQLSTSARSELDTNDNKLIVYQDSSWLSNITWYNEEFDFNGTKRKLLYIFANYLDLLEARTTIASIDFAFRFKMDSYWKTFEDNMFTAGDSLYKNGIMAKNSFTKNVVDGRYEITANYFNSIGVKSASAANIVRDNFWDAWNNLIKVSISNGVTTRYGVYDFGDGDNGTKYSDTVFAVVPETSKITTSDELNLVIHDLKQNSDFYKNAVRKIFEEYIISSQRSSLAIPYQDLISRPDSNVSLDDINKIIQQNLLNSYLNNSVLGQNNKTFELSSLGLPLSAGGNTLSSDLKDYISSNVSGVYDLLNNYVVKSNTQFSEELDYINKSKYTISWLLSPSYKEVGGKIVPNTYEIVDKNDPNKKTVIYLTNLQKRLLDDVYSTSSLVWFQQNLVGTDGKLLNKDNNSIINSSNIFGASGAYNNWTDSLGNASSLLPEFQQKVDSVNGLFSYSSTVPGLQNYIGLVNDSSLPSIVRSQSVNEYLKFLISNNLDLVGLTRKNDEYGLMKEFSLSSNKNKPSSNADISSAVSKNLSSMSDFLENASLDQIQATSRLLSTRLESGLEYSILDEKNQPQTDDLQVKKDFFLNIAANRLISPSEYEAATGEKTVTGNAIRSLLTGTNNLFQRVTTSKDKGKAKELLKVILNMLLRNPTAVDTTLSNDNVKDVTYRDHVSLNYLGKKYEISFFSWGKYVSDYSENLNRATLNPNLQNPNWFKDESTRQVYLLSLKQITVEQILALPSIKEIVEKTGDKWNDLKGNTAENNLKVIIDSFDSSVVKFDGLNQADFIKMLVSIATNSDNQSRALQDIVTRSKDSNAKIISLSDSKVYDRSIQEALGNDYLHDFKSY